MSDPNFRDQPPVIRTDMITSADIDQISTDARCFRFRRHQLVVGLVCAVLFTAMGIASTLSALWNIDGSFAPPERSVSFFATAFSGLTLCAVWHIAAYFREFLFFGKAVIVHHGIFRSKRFEFGEVLQIEWRTWPRGGSVVVRTHSDKVAIRFDNFTSVEREELIRLIRETFAIQIQENWARFEEGVRKSSS